MTIKERIFKAFGIAFTIVIIGTVGYMLLGPDDTTWDDALYMTVVTITTIGFEEVIDQEKVLYGRLFTMLLAFAGIGSFTYMVSTFSSLIIEGHLQKHYSQQKIMKRMEHLRDHYIICGMGRVGQQIADELYIVKENFCFSDISEEVIDKMHGLYGANDGIEGDATDDHFLKKLGVENAKGIFICTNDDNVNLVISLSAKQLNPIIRVITMCKTSGFKSKLKSVGADKVILPHKLGGSRMTSEMVNPSVSFFLENLKNRALGEINLDEFYIPTGAGNFTIEYLKKSGLERAVFLALRAEDRWMNLPSDEEIIHDHDTIVMISSNEEIKLLHELMNKRKLGKA
ncbi:voltage-gated potassium channel [Sediminitomix flava]|uniref:Voltage-gated potassium channel n=2 Tax=Sediminitomix flava TaxID=379075 RepID=A0A315Z5R5_SEDFL|nr:voltage-gated potassium channel [Sediminitomix flava]